MRQLVSGSIRKVREGVQFIEEAWVEMKRVHWPSRKETSATTLVVLVVVMLVSFYLGLIDFGLARLIRLVLS